MSENTKYGDMIDGHEWTDPEPEADAPAPVETKRHTIDIDDNRDSHGYEYGLDWMFFVEDGLVTGLHCGHYLEGRTQSDPMDADWSDVPTIIKTRLEHELNVDDVEEHLDLPDFQRGESDAE